MCCKAKHFTLLLDLQKLPSNPTPKQGLIFGVCLLWCNSDFILEQTVNHLNFIPWFIRIEKWTWSHKWSDLSLEGHSIAWKTVTFVGKGVDLQAVTVWHPGINDTLCGWVLLNEKCECMGEMEDPAKLFMTTLSLHRAVHNSMCTLVVQLLCLRIEDVVS